MNEGGSARFVGGDSTAWRHARGGAITAAFICAYIALDWVSYMQPIEAAGITPWNPPPGLSLALLIGGGMRFAPAVLVGAFASELIVRGASTTREHAVIAALWLAVAYSGVAYWVRRKFPEGLDFHRVADISWFAGVVSAAALVAGIGYVAILSSLDFPHSVSFPRQVVQFWVGDTIGILVMTPVLLVNRAAASWRRIPRLETILQSVLVPAVLWLLWGIDTALAPRLFYVLFLPLIWVCARRGIEGATIALIAIQFGLIAGLQITGRQEMVLELQLLMLTLVFTGLLLGASVSERALVERALRERQAEFDKTLRLAAASETASALAHELNQPLMAISNYIGACRAILAKPEPNRDRLAEALGSAAREAARAGDVTRRIREFFQSGTTRLERVDVAALVGAAIQPMRSALERDGVTLLVDCAPDVGAARLDRIQIESVIHQLVQNAMDAMASARSPHREIRIAADRQGDLIRITVDDSGPGIAPELSSSILSPFVTTKPMGMGMGLSICRTIVENHGGQFSVGRSRSGASISFSIPSLVAEEGT